MAPISPWFPKPQIWHLDASGGSHPPHHNHYDHLDIAAVKLLGNQPRYFVPLGLKPWFVEHGVAPERVREMDWWDKATVGGCGSKPCRRSTGPREG